MSVLILDAKEKAEVVEMFKNGESKAQIAREFEVSSDTIARVIKEHETKQKPSPVFITPTKVEFKGGPTFIEGDLCGTRIIVDHSRPELADVYVLGDAMNGVNETFDLDDCDSIDAAYEADIVVGALYVVNSYYADDDVEGSGFTEITASEFYTARTEAHKSKTIKADIKVETKEELRKAFGMPEPQENIIWNANSKFISITVGRKTYNADKDHPNFKMALQALVEDRVNDALEYINIERKIVRIAKGNVRIENGMVYYKDLMIDSGLTRRILNIVDEGGEVDALINFFEALMENPSRTAVYRLYDFLQANDIEITDRGTFLAWKRVRSDYTDIHSGTFDNSPGKTCEMPRNQVDEDDERTCSAGLHVCSKAYLPHFGASSGNRIVQVEVHPRDVVSIPVDYNNAKMRTAKYIVLKDVTDQF